MESMDGRGWDRMGSGKIEATRFSDTGQHVQHHIEVAAIFVKRESPEA